MVSDLMRWKAEEEEEGGGGWWWRELDGGRMRAEDEVGEEEVQEDEDKGDVLTVAALGNEDELEE